MEVITKETEDTEKETKPIVETKSSLEILSELFSTFHADPPVLIEDEVIKEGKKPKKKKKHKSKDKKHKKKDKKRKRSRSRSNCSSSSKELDFDLTQLLVKQEESAVKKIKIEGTELSLNLDKINDVELEEEDNDVKPCILMLKKENEEGEISSESKEKLYSERRTSKHKHKKDKTKDRTEKLKERTSDSTTKSKHRHRSKSSDSTTKSKHRHRSISQHDEFEDLHKSNDDYENMRHRSRSPHKYSDLRLKIKSKHSSSSHKDEKEYPDSQYKDDHKYRRHRHHNEDDDYYRFRDRDQSYDRTNRDDPYDRNRNNRWHRSRDYNRDNKYRDRRYSSDDSSYIDKKKLLEIARKNAIQMMKSGNLPGALSLGPQAQEKVIAAIKAGGKTIEELTDFCKTLATKEDLGELSDVEDDKISDESDIDKPFNHPFQIKDRPSTITMNIKNSIPLPIKSTQERSTELRMQFPVSSGQHHRKNENEWVPVEPKKDAPPPLKPSIVLTKEVVPITPLVLPSKSAQFLSTVPTPVPAPEPAQQQIDIGAIVSQRLSAMRKLQENPHDVQAISQIYQSTKEVQTWAESKQQPGQFTGTVGGNFLSHSELSSGYQAWARKDQLQSATPLSGGMGMHLLQKMGWKPGEGLGKEKTGALEPLLLEVKLDKKGLVASEESQKRKKVKQVQKAPQNPNSKHPVSLLGEYACKNKLGAPMYELCFECGPDHKKNFLFKVSLNGMEFQPNIASPNKKEAKANAALLCLQKLGIVT